AEDELFQAYFGGNGVNSVTGVPDKITDENDSSRMYLGLCNVCDGNVIAYTLIATTDIYYCDISFDEVATDALCGNVTVNDCKIRGGKSQLTLILTCLQMTHATSGTDDVTYGCPDDQALSDSTTLTTSTALSPRSTPTPSAEWISCRWPSVFIMHYASP
ncbi:hypothetical protein MPER_07934, partial [Moniliophthora perniciosa FA553]